ncbi:hypothetical protein NIES970_23580 [[Synechococcus] sp. NIES-970]|uniref:DUF2949 domain-containing protein n=1 Tax=Picosynechococcus sp. NKBG15041c TaxID=1407650 RepID=UPI0004132CED|nr:DUF2949 domain-containing protein [Picosynechococcus sp. NKBG15041c]BAW97407.1 hypothetical protein NIES970_23580 [[Synechococcus] sp. NIES-970]
MTPITYSKFIHFLKEELAIPGESISVMERHRAKGSAHHPLPMVLWQYGLVTLEQLDRIYEWLETA